MEIFSKSNINVIQFLGGNQIRQKNIKYRLLKYLLTTPFMGKIAVYNNFTSCGILLTEEEYKRLCEVSNSIFVDYAIGNYFLVPEDFDEEAKVNEYRAQRRISANFLETISTFTIFTTTDCNARCFYCYEKGVKKQTMTMEMADNVVKYIVDCSKKLNGKNVKLRWFGGEPLYNMKVIDFICSSLREKGVSFVSTMFTNAYLLNEDIAKIAVENWNLERVQITLDGEEATYNQTKAYLYEDLNPYNTVIDNIKHCIKNSINVVIRFNLTTQNFESLKELIPNLVKEIGLYKNSMHVAPLFEILRGDKEFCTLEERERVYRELYELEGIMRDNGVLIGNNRLVNMKISHCMVDSGNAIVILPDGKLCLCEHDTNDDCFGQLGQNREEWNWDVIKRDIKQKPNNETICHSCVIYPLCLKLYKCPSDVLCDDILKTRGIERVLQSINSLLEDYSLKKKQH